MDTEALKQYLELRVARIEDESIRSLVRQVLEALPPKAWERESSLKYHPEDERGPGGNLLHTLRVTTLVEVLLDATNMSQPARDVTRAAAILHDCCRHGLTASEPYSTKGHPQLVRQLIRENGIWSPWTNSVCDRIETHMGRWGSPPYTLTASSHDILHIADCLAAQNFTQVENPKRGEY